MTVDSTIIQEVKKVLKGFGDTYLLETGALKRSKLIEDLDKYTPILMKELLANALISKSYTEKIGDTTIFKLNQFIEMFTYKEYWEDSYTKYSNKIGLTAGGKFIDETADVVLDFPFKDTVLKAGMTKEDDKDADEPFLNEVIAKSEIDTLFEPKIFVNSVKYDAEHPDGKPVSSFSDDDNLIIKGNNLIALHSIKERYAGKVKLIYIDPPYNTGNDSFNYNDNFNHSAWLTFMKNRLEVARELLSDDGIIAIQTDYHENSYLRIMLDELFGRNNFVSEIAVQMSTASGPKMANIKSTIPKLKDSILIYSKGDFEIFTQPYKRKAKWDKEYSKILMNFSQENRVNFDRLLSDKNYEEAKSLIESVKLSTISKEYPDKKNDEDWLNDNAWRIVADKQNTGLDNLLSKSDKFWQGDVSLAQTKTGNLTLFRTDKDFGADTRLEIVFADKNLNEHTGDLWTDISTSGGFSEEGGVKFPTAKKPEALLKRLIGMFMQENDVVLDFFMGSASTLATAMKMNRRFIGIEQMDYIKTISVQRLKNVISGDQTGISKSVNWQGGGSFVYAELFEKNQGYLKDLLAVKDNQALEVVYDRMVEGTADLDFRVDLDTFKTDTQDMNFTDRKKLLLQIIDKNQLYYQYSEIDDIDVRELVSDGDFEFNKKFYGEKELW